MGKLLGHARLQMRVAPHTYCVRVLDVAYRGPLREPVHYGPGSKRECERRAEQLRKDVPRGITRDVHVFRLWPLFGGRDVDGGR